MSFFDTDKTLHISGALRSARYEYNKVFLEKGAIKFGTPQSWVDMIANGDKNKANKYLQNYVHTLGNLTITGYNQNLSNMSFIDKRDRVNKEGKNIGYKNGLFLNEDVVNEDNWTIDKIEKRTEKMINILMNLYKM